MKICFKKFVRNEKVMFDYTGKNCKVTLNNQKNLNAISQEMVEAMRCEIPRFEQNTPCTVLITSHSSSKGFSAGGDVKYLYSEIVKGNPKAADRFFADYYSYGNIFSGLNQKGINTCAVWNGVVMGGGVGLTIFSDHVVSTEKTVFAMPETRIGFFPDVGVIKKLSKLPLGLARAIAVCGDRLSGIETYLCGLSRHYILSSSKEALEAEILACISKGKQDSSVDHILRKYQENVPESTKMQFEQKLDKLDVLFSGNSLLEIQDRLTKSSDPEAIKYSQMMNSNSPYWMTLSFEYLQRAKTLSLHEIFSTDYFLAKKAIDHSDFVNGIECLLVNKITSRPPWNPNTLADVNAKEISDLFLIKPSLI